MEHNSHKPVLIVIAGPNGSGKTTVTTKILKHEWMEDAVYVNPDIVAQEKYGDWNSATAIQQSIRYCEDLREECLINIPSIRRQISKTIYRRNPRVGWYNFKFYIRSINSH